VKGTSTYERYDIGAFENNMKRFTDIIYFKSIY